MTIAACYVSPEGIVLGADSASTYTFPTGHHHFNYGQKLFEIGIDSTLGMVTWGLGGLALGSYRTLAARLSDLITTSTINSVLDAAVHWIDMVWPIYSNLPEVAFTKTLNAKLPFDPAAPASPGKRTQVEELQLANLKNQLIVGFCIGGYVLVDRMPAAFEIIFDPLAGKPIPNRLPMAQSFWGVPAITHRLIKGCADEIRDAILGSGKWNGTTQELNRI